MIISKAASDTETMPPGGVRNYSNYFGYTVD
jgi:hypothetical protein